MVLLLKEFQDERRGLQERDRVELGLALGAEDMG